MDKPKITVSTIHTSNTRPHNVQPVGRQHADDQAPMGQCVTCGDVGEWGALTQLLPNAYGCPGYRIDE